MLLRCDARRAGEPPAAAVYPAPLAYIIRRTHHPPSAGCSAPTLHPAVVAVGVVLMLAAVGTFTVTACSNPGYLPKQTPGETMNPDDDRHHGDDDDEGGR